MRILGSTIGRFQSADEAAQYQKIQAWRKPLDGLADEMKSLDGKQLDLDWMIPGQVTLSGSWTCAGHPTAGRAIIDATGTVISLDAKATNPGPLLTPVSTRFHIRESSENRRYSTHCWGVTHELMVDKATGDLDYRVYFLGIQIR